MGASSYWMVTAARLDAAGIEAVARKVRSRRRGLEAFVVDEAQSTLIYGEGSYDGQIDDLLGLAEAVRQATGGTLQLSDDFEAQGPRFRLPTGGRDLFQAPTVLVPHATPHASSLRQSPHARIRRAMRRARNDRRGAIDCLLDASEAELRPAANALLWMGANREAARLYDLAGAPRASRLSRARAGDLALVLDEIIAEAQSPDATPAQVLALDEELVELVPEQAPARRAEVDRGRQPWREEPLTETGAMRRAQARELAHRWRRWPVGRSYFALQGALAMVTTDPAGARATLEGEVPHAELADVRAELEHQLASGDAPTANAIASLQAAYAAGTQRQEVAADLGLALMRAERLAEAWEPLEHAALNLSSSHPATPAVFAALERLEAEGFGP